MGKFAHNPHTVSTQYEGQTTAEHTYDNPRKALKVAKRYARLESHKEGNEGAVNVDKTGRNQRAVESDSAGAYIRPAKEK